MQLTFFYFLPTMLLSGFMFPFQGMPRWAQWIGEVLPATYFMRLVRGILLKGNDWVDLWPNIWPMIVFTVLVMTIAVAFYRRRWTDDEADSALHRVVMVAALAACAGDPLRPPELPAADQYTASAVTLPGPRGRHARRPGAAPGAGQRHAGGLVDAVPVAHARRPGAPGAASSPTLEQAQARLRQAQEDYTARSGAQAPRVDAKLSANRIDADPQALGLQVPLNTPFNLYLATVGVSYTFDLFGAVRRELEAQQAEVDHQRYELEAAR